MNDFEIMFWVFFVVTNMYNANNKPESAKIMFYGLCISGVFMIIFSILELII